MKRTVTVSLVLATLFSILSLALAPTACAQQKKPNILFIMTDDVGVWNVSAYHRGMMGGRTPNIDRIANEGALFTDYYAQQSCTAGRCVYHRTASLPHGSVGRRDAGFAPWATEGRSHDRGSTEAARIRHRSNWQEPPRRPQRIPAYCTRLR